LSAFNEANGHCRKGGGKKKKIKPEQVVKKENIRDDKPKHEEGNIKNKKLGPTKNGFGVCFFFVFFPF
jgi:hypothetical protein